MVVAEYHMEDVEDAAHLSKKQILDGLTDIGAPAYIQEERLVVELTPNRLDLLSLGGVARALRLFYKKQRPRAYTSEPSKYELVVDKGVTGIRPYTAWAVARGLDFSGRGLQYLIQFQEKLDATIGRRVRKAGIGFYPMEKLKFPLKYTTMKPRDIVYRPLNYPKGADALEILEKHPKGKEYGPIIRGFDRYPVFLDAEDNILCLIPICNAKDYGEVTAQTTDVAIEVTGTDLNTVLAILDIICCGFIDGGAKIHQVKMRYPQRTFQTPLLESRKVKWDLGFANRVLGNATTVRQAEQYLQQMDIQIQGKTAVAPPYRVDIIHLVDVVEDLAIAQRYDSFTPRLPNISTIGRTGTAYPTHDTMRRMGFLEIQTPVLTRAVQLREFGMDAVEVQNPVSEEYAAPRPSLVPGLVSTLAYNRMKALPQKIYEIGQVVGKTEEQRLAFALRDEKISFADARGYLQTFMKEQRRAFELRKEDAPPWLDAEESGRLWVEGIGSGWLGRVHSRIAASGGLEGQVYICEVLV